MDVLALLLTDVVGSTRLWQDEPDAMWVAMARHHEIVHGVVDRHGGWRPGDQGEGDAVFAAFSSCVAALAAAVDIQRGLAAEPWTASRALTVRVGVHVGEVAQRDGNLFGDPVNRCARIRGLAAGGQLLVSSPVRDLARDRVPDDVGFRDVGEHRMKDLTRPERLFQLTAPGLADDFPVVVGLDRATHNLPVLMSGLIGREAEVAELVDLVGRERLVTVTGFGGKGKTRLALQVAAEVADGDGDGVWFIDLSTQTDPDRVWSQIAQTLAIPVDRDAELAVVDYLTDRRLLLVLDNLEQLLPEVASIVGRLVRSSPDLRVLATCREPLHVGGEHDYALDPLSLPPVSFTSGATSGAAAGVVTPAEVAALSTYAAVNLFIARARAARRTFEVTTGNAAAVAAICTRLDGLPLAIELAAARIRSMSPEALLPRLDQALRVGGDRTLPTRHQTLTATIAWSYDALDQPDQVLLERLSVFTAPFTLDAAEAITGPALQTGATPDRADGAAGDDEAELSVLDGLARLVERSLVRYQPTTDPHDTDRYVLLTTIRGFAATRLEQHGHVRALAAAHAAYYTNLVDLPPDYTRQQLDQVLVSANLELTHLLDAMEHQHHHGSPHDQARLLWPLLFRLMGRLQNVEVQRLSGRYLSQPDLPPADRALIQDLQVGNDFNSGQLQDARTHAAEALTAAEASGDPTIVATILIKQLILGRHREEVRQLINRVTTMLEGAVKGGGAVPLWYLEGLVGGTSSWTRWSDPNFALDTATLAADAASVTDQGYLDLQVAAVLTSLGRWAEAERLVTQFEPPDGSTVLVVRLSGLMSAATLRISTGNYARALKDLDDLEALTSSAHLENYAHMATLWRARIAHLQDDPETARAILATLPPLTDPESHAETALLLARLTREAGDLEQAHQDLAAAWITVAGSDAQYLNHILNCLTEGALQHIDTEPHLALTLATVARAHQGPFVLDPAYNLDDVLAEFGEQTLPTHYAPSLNEPLPEDPDWDALLTNSGDAAATPAATETRVPPSCCYPPRSFEQQTSPELNVPGHRAGVPRGPTAAEMTFPGGSSLVARRLTSIVDKPR